MSPECAEKCGIMRLLDNRFAGVARGVGTAQILGRVHSAQMKVADLHLSCAFTIMEGRDMDLLFGLDMLKAHQAVIDLANNVLRIRGREVRFLAEHELPEKARLFESGTAPEEHGVAGPSGSGTNRSPATQTPQPQHFPGSGHTLGTAPRASPSVLESHANRYPEANIQTLMGLGATREVAIQALDAASGNVEYAASMLFNF